MYANIRSVVALLCAWALTVYALLDASESGIRLTITNDRLTVSVNKSTGAIDVLTLDNQDLLGTKSYETPTPGGATGSGNSGIGPYLDCYCIPDGSYTPGSISPQYKLLSGSDATGTTWGGIVMSETYPPTGQLLEQYWFLRDGETGLHTYSRLAYHNKTTPFLRNLQEFRTLFRPNTHLWTHLSTNARISAPLPYHNPATGDVADTITVQDATWYLPNSSDPYVQQVSDYFTKYTFSDTWRDHKVHGIFADGTNSDDGSTFGAWFVMNTVDTYFGGPLHSDLTVDGIVYNYIVSNHHGAQTPNITDGFDRTFGPGYYHFNRGEVGGTLEDLRADALQYANLEWNLKFYDSIAAHVPNYVPSTQRGEWRGHIHLPWNAKDPIAVLSLNGTDFQDNAFDVTAYQYWHSIFPDCETVHIVNIKPGIYRLTIYATGTFGAYIQDNIIISPNKTTLTNNITWTEERASPESIELWRIGTPDKSSAEYLHGDELSNRPLHFPEYRLYWAIYDFIRDFPHGVHIDLTTSFPDNAPELQMNYIHWSVFGGPANSLRPDAVTGSGNINNWTIAFEISEDILRDRKEAVFTVQLASAKTAAGNTDVYDSTQVYSDLAYTVVVNGEELESWVIPYYQSSSCAVRSAMSCYNLEHKFVFDVRLLRLGKNDFVLSVPYNATNYESALLPGSVYVQYDAVRLEVR